MCSLERIVVLKRISTHIVPSAGMCAMSKAGQSIVGNLKSLIKDDDRDSNSYDKHAQDKIEYV